MKNKRILCMMAVIAVVVVVLLVGVSAYRSATLLTMVHYELETDLTEPIRLVQLTDLHGKAFGEENEELVQLAADAKPDLILMTGDMLDRGDENADVVCRLIRVLAQIAPVYYGYGNHEYQWMRNHGESLTPILENAGAVVLDVSYKDVEVNGQALRLGGYHGYYRIPGMFQITDEQRNRELDFCIDFEATDRCKLLLCHIPTAWLDWGYIDKFPVDLVLSGHYHGGQIRLPLLGGIYAPEAGIFPEYTQGLYTGSQAACILSAGLGSSPGIPRINNLPQIVVVELK